jgi:hypothetical protein
VFGDVESVLNLIIKDKKKFKKEEITGNGIFVGSIHN